jgi:haloacetate dehalogenase
MTGWFEHFEERRFALGGAEIAARLGGDRGKPALLLLHGFPRLTRCGTAWRSA